MAKRPEVKIALYGGTSLLPENADFVRHLARAFLEADPHVVLVGGGIFDPKCEKTSVDLATYQGADSFVQEKGGKLEERLQTWLTEGEREGIERTSWGESILLEGSPVSRRFQLVKRVDALVTIEGEGQTATVLELAMALKRVALPIGFTGKDSGYFWQESAPYFKQILDLEASLAEQLSQRPTSADYPQLAAEIASAVLRRAERRCLVLLDFEDDNHKNFLTEVVSPTVESEGFAVHKLDKQESAGDILSLFLARLDDCHAIIADLTGFNRNVLYELGRAHHHGRVQPLMFIRGSESDDVPFYISKYLFHRVGQDGSRAEAIIRAYLLNENNMRSEIGPRDGRAV